MAEEVYRPTASKLPTAEEVAQWLGGEAREIADPALRYTGLATLAEADAQEIAFVANEKAAREAQASRAGLLLVGAGCDVPGRPRIAVDQVWTAVAVVMQRMYPEPEPSGEIHATAVIGGDVTLGSGVSIGPYCVVGDGAEIGDGTILGSHCIVGAGCRIGDDCRLVARVTLGGVTFVGDRVTIHPGAVLGADGFKFEVVGGRVVKIPQIGAVIVEDDVEIGANTTIDRAFINETRICRGAKIDNQVQIAHNVRIGPGSLMAAKVGIAGSSRLGAGCMLGGNAGLADGVTLGNGVMVGANSGVNADWPDGSIIQGSPALPMKQFWKNMAALNRLPELLKRVKGLEKHLGIDGEGRGGSKD
jgi:UDP-3-O-[3-hydroxymyristoyl] glucosamine N-acyltransferase